MITTETGDEAHRHDAPGQQHVSVVGEQRRQNTDQNADEGQPGREQQRFAVCAEGCSQPAREWWRRLDAVAVGFDLGPTPDVLGPALAGPVAKRMPPQWVRVPTGPS